MCLASLPKLGERTSIWEERCVLNDFLPRPNLRGCSPLSLSELIFGIPLRSDVAEDCRKPVTFGCSLMLCWDAPRVFRIWELPISFDSLLDSKAVDAGVSPRYIF